MPIAANLYYHIYLGGKEGERPPVVLLHGAGGNHLSWPPEMRRLPGYRVHALDLPGHGKSPGHGEQTIQGYAGAVLDWMQAVGLHQAVFIGHSMGSGIALQLALDASEQVTALGLIGASARLRVSPALLESTANPAAYASVIETITAWSFGPQTSPRLMELAAKRLLETRQTVLHGDFLACDGFDVTGRLNEIQQPALVVSGTEDKMTPLRYAQLLAGNLQYAKLQSLAGAGHMVMLERPKETAEIFRGFLDELPNP